jgi:hypothetical protein
MTKRALVLAGVDILVVVGGWMCLKAISPSLGH